MRCIVWYLGRNGDVGLDIMTSYRDCFFDRYGRSQPGTRRSGVLHKQLTIKHEKREIWILHQYFLISSMAFGWI